MGDGDLLGELEVSDLSDPLPMHSLLPDADPNLWRILASFKLMELMEEGVKEGWGDGGIGDNWGMTKYFWAFSVVSLCCNKIIFEFSRAFQQLIISQQSLLKRRFEFSRAFQQLIISKQSLLKRRD